MAAVVIFRLHELWPPLRVIRPALLLTIGGFAVILATTKAEKVGEAFRVPIVKATGLLVLWALCTIPTSIWRGNSISVFQGLVLNAMIVVSLAMLPATERHFRFVLRWFLIFAGVLSLALFVVGRAVVDGRYSVSYSLDPNDLAAVLAISAPLALGLALRGRGLERTLGFASFGLFSLAIVRTGSRGGTLALLIALLTFVLLQRGALRGRLAMLALPLLAVAWVAAPDSYRERMASLARGEKDYNATEYGGRQQIWKRGIKYVVADPVFGSGIGNYEAREGENMKAEGVTGHWSTAHNTYLQAAVDLGLPGFSLLIGMLFASLRLAWQIARSPSKCEQPEFLAALLGCMVAAFFLSHTYAYHLYGLLGLVALRWRTTGLGGRTA